jgi:SNF2 family DNA or RNA helicase
MTSAQIPENPDELQEWIKSQESQLEDFIVVGTKVASEIEEDLKEERELERQLVEKRRARAQRQQHKSELNKVAKNKQVIITAAKSKLDAFLSEKAIQEKYEAERAKYLEKAAGFKWREQAYRHQLDGATRLASAKRAILGDKRGLGKTLTSIAFMDMSEARKILIVTPRDVMGNFQREINGWADHRPSQILGGMTKDRRDGFLTLCASPMMKDLLLIINYEAWRKDPSLIAKIADIKFDTVICDEAHMMKNDTTSAFKGVNQIVYAENCCPLCSGAPEKWRNPVTGISITRCSVCLYESKEFGDFCSVKNCVPMTGTAILNRPDDLWPLLYLVDRVKFPSKMQFLNAYCDVNLEGRWIFKSGGEKRLTASLGMRYIARDAKSAGVTMPPQEVTHHYLEPEPGLYPMQFNVMHQIEKLGAIKMADDVSLNIAAAIAELTRRRQAVVWPAGIVIRDPKTKEVLYRANAHESQKMDKVEATVLQAFEEEDRVVVFSQFKEALKELDRRLVEHGFNVARYDGDTREDQRQIIQKDFDVKTAYPHSFDKPCIPSCPNWQPEWQRFIDGDYSEGDRPTCSGGYTYDVVLCNYKTGGVGLNLNAARQMVIMDREWNDGKEEQAFGRIQRLDTKHDTIVHVIHIENTVDEFMDNLIEFKRKIFEGFATEAELQEKLRRALAGDYSVDKK